MNEMLDVNIMGEKADYYLNQDVILKVTMQYPQINSRMDHPAILKINQSYLDQASEFWCCIKDNLRTEAIEQYQRGEPGRDSIPPYEVVLTTKLTYQDPCTFSLYFDEYQYSGGAHGNTVRNSDTWNLNTGQKYQLKDFFAPAVDYQAYLAGEIIRQIEEQLQLGNDFYFENYQQLVHDHLNPANFYLVGGDCPDGMVIYFQQYEIAPYSSGIREFFIPF